MTDETKHVPELRFPEFKDEWVKNEIGKYIDEIRKFDTQQDSGFPVVTSSRRVLYKQDNYFDGEREFSKKNVLYSVVPPNMITYRHMSDDNIFKFNINFFNENVLVSKEYPVFDVNEYADKFFIFYELNNNIRFLKFCIKQKKGGTRTRLYFNVLKKYQTFIPHKSEQQKIGDFFSKLDRQIELEEQKLEQLEAQKKGYMQKIFSQELRFKDEDGNDYPEWKVEQIDNILSERKTYQKKESNIPHATLSTNGISLKSERYDRDFLVKDKNKKYKISNKDDICYNPANLKFGVITRNKIGTVIFSPIHITFEVNENYDPIFIEKMITRWDFINKIRKFEEGTVYERMAVKPEDFLTYETAIPFLEEQQKIGDFFNDFDILIEKQSQKIDLLKQRKQGFLQKMFV